MTDPAPPSGCGGRLVGMVLMVSGALLAALCGLCSGVLLFPPTPPGMEHSFGWRQPGTLLIVLLVGGTPVLAGLVTFFAGLMIYRQARR